MPIKYTFTKNDMFAGKVHSLVQRRGEDEHLRTQATLIAAFASGHSWQTNKLMKEPSVSMESFSNSKEAIRSEYTLARSERWKNVKASDIQEVASMNIGPSAFSMWLLTAGVEKGDHGTYKSAWATLQREFAQACDDISGTNQ
jgi:hypothetical protein